MAAGFLEKGWEVEVATSPIEPSRNSMEWRGARIHEFVIAGNGLPKNPFRGDTGKYQAFLEQENWDAVVFHGHSWTLYVPLRNLRKISGKKILVSHGFNALQWVRVGRFPWGLYAWFCSACSALRMFFWIRAFDRTVYLSERRDLGGFIDHWIASVLGHEGRRVIPNGVDANLRGENADAFRRNREIAGDQVLFLYVSNYSRRKDQGYAARAFRAANLANAVMVFIGSEFNSDSTRYQSEDDALACHQKTGRIIWLDKMDRTATLDAFAACDVFVLSADHEALPIALLEAMREGKPWIARDVGCISELPGGVCIHSEAEMSRQMIRLSLDPDLRAGMGRQGRAAIEKTYNRRNYVDSYCDLVSEVTRSDGDHERTEDSKL